MYSNQVTVKDGKIINAKVYNETGAVVAEFDNQADFVEFVQANIEKYPLPEYTITEDGN